MPLEAHSKTPTPYPRGDVIVEEGLRHGPRVRRARGLDDHGVELPGALRQARERLCAEQKHRCSKGKLFTGMCCGLYVVCCVFGDLGAASTPLGRSEPPNLAIN